jgi:hypothetical protein
MDSCDNLLTSPPSKSTSFVRLQFVLTHFVRYDVSYSQGDQIGRFFAIKLGDYFLCVFLKITEVAYILLLLFND